MNKRHQTRAFSLIELVIVVVVMGIIAAMAVTRLGDMSARSKITATKESLRAIQATVDEEQAATGAWPTVLTAAMFSGGRLPRNALLPSQVLAIETVFGAATEPGAKVPSGPGDGAFWYNAQLGIVRARVSKQDSDAQTLALYNLINGTRSLTLEDPAPIDSGGATSHVDAGGLGVTVEPE